MPKAQCEVLEVNQLPQKGDLALLVDEERDFEILHSFVWDQFPGSLYSKAGLEASSALKKTNLGTLQSLLLDARQCLTLNGSLTGDKCELKLMTFRCGALSALGEVDALTKIENKLSAFVLGTRAVADNDLQTLFEEVQALRKQSADTLWNARLDSLQKQIKLIQD